MEPHQRMDYLLGRAIALNLPTQTSRLSPTLGDLKLIAQCFGMGIDQARSALATFNAHTEKVSRYGQWRSLLHDKAEALEYTGSSPLCRETSIRRQA